ncbi:MAG: hypothetical protein JXJ17_18255 [Anaerolineae bacterium]|nr:hypothetical protein [Anaerolineae bacterium]
MMVSKPADNPVFVRLTGDRRSPSLRVTVIGGVVVGLGLLALSMVGAISAAESRWWAVLRTAGWIYALLLPFGVSIAAAIITGRDLPLGARLDLKNEINPQTVVEGYWRASLFRMRVPLAVVIGLLPMIAVGPFTQVVMLDRFFGGSDASIFFPAFIESMPSATLYAVTWSVAQSAAGIGLLGVNVFAAALGVYFALGQLKAFPAPVAAPLSIPILILPMMCLVALVGPYYMMPLFDAGSAVKVIVLSIVLFALPPYALALLVIRLAARGRWVEDLVG